MAGILLYSEKNKLVQELASAGQDLAAAGSGEIFAMAVNQQQAMKLSEKGLQAFYLNTELPVADVAGMASILQQAAEQLNVDTILLSSNRRGKELSGRLAEAWGAGCLTDVKGFTTTDGQATFIRNTLGGATVASQVIKSPRRIIALTPRSFAPYEGDGSGFAKVLDVNVPAPSVKVVEIRQKSGDMVDIQAAERLVIVGQGVADQSDLGMVEKIASLLGAEVACSKPVASDKKWLPEDRVVGLSGKICKPALALILGVSGQVQFTVGVREAQVIISVNNDENAYINKISDYSLGADLKLVLPELVAALE